MTPVGLLVCCLLLLGVWGQMRVDPPSALLPVGGSILVNCSTECPDPKLITLETSLRKELAGEARGWAAFWLRNVSADSQILCVGVCDDEQMISSSGITVYGFPERVELAPLPAWQPVGKNLTLGCQVVGGEPRAQLTVVLLRGKEELSRQPLSGGPQEVAEVTTTVLANRSDHGVNFSCRAELDLRPQGLELFRNASVPRQLRTYVLPVTPPSLGSPLILEVGTSRSVHCSLDGLFPASEARVRMALGDQILNVTVRSHGDTLRATAMARALEDEEGVSEMVCNVSFGDQSVEARKNLTIFRFPKLVLHVSETNVSEGSVVNVTCTSGSQVQVTLVGAPIPPRGKPAWLQLNATEGDNRRAFLCHADFEVGGAIAHRNTTVRLSVLYGPKIDRAQCPQRLVWKDTTTKALQCQARGNPAPQLLCRQQGSRHEVPIGTPFRVNFTHQGTYQCQAVSSRGTDTVVVVIEVQAQNRNPSWIYIVLGVLALVGLVIIAVAIPYVFGLHKRCGKYRVQRTSTSVPLRPLQTEDTERAAT